MFNIGPLEIAVISLIALLVVGPKRLPEVGRMVAKTLRQFRTVQEEFTRSIDLNLDGNTPPSFDRPPPSSSVAGGETGRGGRRTARRDQPAADDETSGETPEDPEEAIAPKQDPRPRRTWDGDDGPDDGGGDSGDGDGVVAPVTDGASAMTAESLSAESDLR